MGSRALFLLAATALLLTHSGDRLFGGDGEDSLSGGTAWT